MSRIGAERALKTFDDADLTSYIMQMYPMYHTERIENAFEDIDRKLGAAIKAVPTAVG